MNTRALATDYDGTIARNDRVDPSTIAALERWRASGRRLVLVTGRELEELRRVFDRVDLFDRVVAENGALIHRPADGSARMLAGPPPAGFVEALRGRGVGPISVGRAVVATWAPHDATALEVIRSMGLDLEVILNKRAVMVLPPGVDKASGLRVALEELGLAASDVLGVGDAENDRTFLALCGRSAAVANALPAVQASVDVVTTQSHGAGVTELIDAILTGAGPSALSGPEGGHRPP